MPYSPHLRTPLVSLFLIFLNSPYRLLAHAKTVSRIIDDTHGDEATGYLPVYSPQGGTVWQPNCNAVQGCGIAPDETMLRNGTWTAATYQTSMSEIGITLEFEGTAISVYFILTSDIGKTITRNTECNFTLDGTSTHQFKHEPTSEKGFDYDYEAYKATALENKRHTLAITTGKLDHQTYISFDYARYTTEVPDDPLNNTNGASPSNITAAKLMKKTSASVGVVVGAVVGGVGLLAL